METDPKIEDQAQGQPPVGTPEIPPAAQAPEPFWKRIDPTIESEEKAAEAFESYRTKNQELEQKLSEASAGPKYASSMSRKIDEFVVSAVANGADEKTALAQAREYFNAQTRDYETEAGTNPMSILLEKHRAENPGMPEERLKKVIANRYGLTLRKPGEDASEDEVAAYNEAIDLGQTQMEMDARAYGRELNSKKETLGLAPEVREYRQNVERQQKAHSEFMPKAMQAFSRQASSLKVTVEGMEIDLSEYAAPGGRVDPRFEAAVKGFNPSDYSIDGVIDDDAVRDISAGVIMFHNFPKVLAKAIKMGIDKNAKDVTDKKLNIVPPGTTQTPVASDDDWRESLKRRQQRQGNLTQ